MTLVQLKYAVTLEKIRNFALAAQELFIAQPTLSLQIQKLEKHMGILIFDRTTNPISITVEGKEFLKQARIVLQESEKLEFMYSQKNGTPSGEIRLGIIPTVASSLLVKIIPLVKSKYPELQLRIFELPTNQIIQKLEGNEIDIGMLATPLSNRKIKEYPLYYEPFQVYFPSGSIPDGDVRIEDIQEREMIILGEEHCFRGQSLKICKNNSPGRIEAGSFETIKKLVDNNLGLTLLPQFEEVQFKERIRSLVDPKPAREISLVTNISFFKIKILNTLKNEILNLVPGQYHSKKDFHIIGVEA
ncbi:MAG: LysR family transcriptional regulator [Leptospiraceae bacterium]|nr:LysR family transcriptional regulator [Leptospiraceae bacterium]MCP5513820.1 LysR family transcriptional regulator [Leptospiraceae bacterium]